MADQRDRIARVFAGPDALVAYVASLAVLVLAIVAPVPVLQVPGTLLLVAFDALQRSLLPGVTGVAYDVLLAGFLYALAVAVAGVRRAMLARVARPE
ncbi:MAG: hypothetical protein ABEJ59_00365 [Halanaeroarchaeum sp.]